MKKLLTLIIILIATQSSFATATMYGQVLPDYCNGEYLPTSEEIQSCIVKLRDSNGVLVGTSSINSFLYYNVSFTPFVFVEQYVIEIDCPKGLASGEGDPHQVLIDNAPVNRNLDVCYQ
jgi:hypothetical protein